MALIFRPTSFARSGPFWSGLDLALVAALGALLFVRVLTDDRSASDSRHSGSLNLSAVIALLFISAAVWLLVRERHGAVPAALSATWVGIWTLVAVKTNGASSETLREGVREISVLAIAVIVYNARRSFTVPVSARLVQFAGVIPAALAIYQLASQTGRDVAGNIRSNGTLAHPNSAAMFFAIAVTASLWLYLDDGRRPWDALFAALFAVALIATFSIDGLVSFVVMMLVFGALRSGTIVAKSVPFAVAGAVVIIFFATPLGSKRVASEATTSLSAADRGETTSTLNTRLYRWKTLIPEWERSPVLGRGLGTTTTTEGTPSNRLNGLLPHNEYIRYLVETGVLGTLLLLGGLLSLVRAIVRKRDSISGLHNVAPLVVTLVAGCLINALADNTLLNSPTCYAAALIVAAVLAAPPSPLHKPSIAQVA